MDDFDPDKELSDFNPDAELSGGPAPTDGVPRTRLEHLGEAVQPWKHIYRDFKEGVSEAATGLNPFSEEVARDRDAYYKELAETPWYDPRPEVKEALRGLGRVGKGIMGVGKAALSPLTGLEQSVRHLGDAVLPPPTPEEAAELEAKSLPKPPGGGEALINALGVISPARTGVGWRSVGHPAPAPGQPPTPPSTTVSRPSEVIRSEGQRTRDLPAVQREQDALQGIMGAPAQERALEFFEKQQQPQIEEAVESVRRTLRETPQSPGLVSPREGAEDVVAALTRQHDARNTNIEQIGRTLDAAREYIRTQLSPTQSVLARDPNEAAQIVSQAVGAAEEAAQAATNAAYARFRELPGQYHPATFNRASAEIRQRLAAPEDPAQVTLINQQTTPTANAALKLLDEILGGIAQRRDPETGRVIKRPPVTPALVENARKRLSALRGQAIRAAQADGKWADANAMERVIDEFDALVLRKSRTAFRGGDADEIMRALQEARNLYSQHRRTYHSRGSGDKVGPLMQQIIGRHEGQALTPEQLSKTLYGGNASVPLARRLNEIFGNAPEVMGALRQGLVSHIIEAPPGKTPYTPQQIAKRIEEFTRGSGRSLTEQYLTPDQIRQLRTFGEGQRRYGELLDARPDRVERVLRRMTGADGAPRASLEDTMTSLYGAILKSNENAPEMVRRLVSGPTPLLSPPQVASLREGTLRYAMQAVGKGDEAYSYKRIADNLHQLTNTEAGKALYTPQQRAMLTELEQLYRDLILPGDGKNWSGTAHALAPVVKMIGNRITQAIATAIAHMAGAGVGTSEVVGFGVSKVAERAAQIKQARDIAKQLPLIREQMRNYQKALRAYNKAQNSLTKKRLAGAATSLNAATSKIGIDLARIPALQLPGTGLAEDENSKVPSRAEGGSLTAPFDPDAELADQQPQQQSFSAGLASLGKSFLDAFAEGVSKSGGAGIKSYYEALSNEYVPEGAAYVNDAGEYLDAQGNVLPTQRRPNLLPVTRTEPGQGWFGTSYEGAMPAMADVWNTFGAPAKATSVAMAAAKAGTEGKAASQAAHASQETSPIRSAAIRYEGKVYEGATHLDALEKIAKKHRLKTEDLIDEFYDGMVDEDLGGFVTRDGKYVTREQAARLVKKPGRGLDEPFDSADLKINGGLYADSGTEGRIASQVAQATRGPELQLPPVAPEPQLPAVIENALADKPQISEEVKNFLRAVKPLEEKYGADWAEKATPEDVAAIKADPALENAVKKVQQYAPTLDRLMGVETSRRGLFRGAARAAAFASNASRLAQLLDKAKVLEGAPKPDVRPAIYQKLREAPDIYKERMREVEAPLYKKYLEVEKEWDRAKQAVYDQFQENWAYDHFKEKWAKSPVNQEERNAKLAEVDEHYEPLLQKAREEWMAGRRSVKEAFNKEFDADLEKLDLPKLSREQQVVLDYLVNRGSSFHEFQRSHITQNPYKIDPERFREFEAELKADPEFGQKFIDHQAKMGDPAALLYKMTPEEKAQIAEHLKPALLQDRDLRLADARMLAKAFPTLRGFALFSDAGAKGRLASQGAQFLREGTDVYHGTQNPTFERFYRTGEGSLKDSTIDRMLGTHVAPDAEISNTFVRQDGGVYPLRIPKDAKFLDVPQRERGFDQFDIERFVMAHVYQKDPAMLSRYLQQARAVPEQQADEAANALSRGEYVDWGEGLYNLERLIENFGGRPYNKADRAAAVDVFRKDMQKAGYAGLRYRNTSPMETKNARDLTSYIVFDPGKHLQNRLTGAFMTDSGAEGRAASQAAQATRPEGGKFYSAVERAVEGAKQQKATPQQWLNWLKNQPGVTKEELEYLNLDDWAKKAPSGAITKDEFLNNVREGALELDEHVWEPRQIDEAKLQEELEKHVAEWKASLEEDYPQGPSPAALEEFRHYREAHLRRYADDYGLLVGEGRPPRYENYTLPGGENYREIIVTLPTKYKETLVERAQKLFPGTPYRELTGQQRAALARSFEADSTPSPNFSHSHWPGVENPLYHMRVKDREIPGVGKSFHLEELQSDWHQRGRDKGYYDPKQQEAAHQNMEAAAKEIEPYLKKVLQQYHQQYQTPVAQRIALNDAFRRLREVGPDVFLPLARYPDAPRDALWRYYDAAAAHAEASKGHVPNAPFKKNWAELGLRNALLKAVQGGYDAISWTPGLEQAKRYNLATHIERLEYNPKTNVLQAYPKARGRPITQHVPPERLPEVIGEEVTKKLLAQPIDKEPVLKEVPPKIQAIVDKMLPGQEGRHPWTLGVHAANVHTSGHPENITSRLTAEEGRKYVVWYRNNPPPPNLYSSSRTSHVLNNADMMMGGEGMKAFYDKMLVNKANDLGKKYGAKVEWKSLKDSEKGRWREMTDEDFELFAGAEEGSKIRERGDVIEILEPDGRHLQRFDEEGNYERVAYDPSKDTESVDTKVPVLRITPELRKHVIEKGLPLFADSGTEGRAASQTAQALREPAPVFYSAAEKFLERTDLRQASAQQWEGLLKNARGVKPDELKWTGIEDFLARKKAAGEKVTREELQDHLATNKVDVQEVERGGAGNMGDDEMEEQINALVSAWRRGEIDLRVRRAGPGSFEIYDAANGGLTITHATTAQRAEQRLNEIMYSVDNAASSSFEEGNVLGWARDAIQIKAEGSGFTRYGEYQTPGGKNYRELLLTLNTPESLEAKALKEATRQREVSDPKKFYSSHWDEPNVIAHTRFTTREVPRPYTKEEEAALEGRKAVYAKIEENRVAQNAVARKIQELSVPFQQEREKAIRESLRAGKIDRAEAVRQFETYEPAPGIEALQEQLKKLWAQEDELKSKLPPEPKPTNKTLFIEEIQSDWHQRGRKFGYRQEKDVQLDWKDIGKGAFSVTGPKGFHATVGDLPSGEWVVSTPYSTLRTLSSRELAEAYVKYLARVSKGGDHKIPDAPFKKTWPELVFKRLLRYAADNGFDAIAWVSGGANKTNPVVMGSWDDNAQRSNKGLKRFYDEEITNIAKKYAKQHGTEVEIRHLPESDVELGGVSGEQAMTEVLGIPLEEQRAYWENLTNDERDALREQLWNHRRQERSKFFYMPLPDSLKRQATEEGFALFAKGGEGKVTSHMTAAWNALSKKEQDEFRKASKKKGESVRALFGDPAAEGRVASQLAASQRENSKKENVGGPGGTQPDRNADEGQNRAAGGRVVAANIDHNPTEGQKEAGNYKKDKIHILGLQITIENAKGKPRSGIGHDGKRWSVTMPAHYGYVNGSVGADKDHVDVYVGPHTKAPNVYVIDQYDAETGAFDEHKCCVGFASEKQALDTYLKGFSDGKGPLRFKAMKRMTADEFKRWVFSPKAKKPIAS